MTKPDLTPRRLISTYTKAVPSPAPAQPRKPDWTPPKWESTRPGADDHKQYKSRGIA